jgi:HD-GYP domain-containing protein (c-di-GMP phosphodiesterase class II)
LFTFEGISGITENQFIMGKTTNKKMLQFPFSLKINKKRINITPAFVYQLIVDSIGLIIIFLAAVSVQFQADMIWVYLFWVIFSTATELKPITMPNNDQLTISFAVHISALILFGAPIAILVSTVANIITDVIGKRGLKKMLFNISQYAITIQLAWFVYDLLRWNTGPLHLKTDSPAMLLSCLVYVAINFFLVTTVISLSQGSRLLRQLTSDVKLELIHFATLVPVSLLIVILYDYEPLSIIILLLPLAMAHFSFENYMNLRMETRNTIEVLADIIDKRDGYTSEHSRRVAYYCSLIADEIGMLGSDHETLVTTAKVHDLGKVYVPDSILLKAGHLIPEEQAIMANHALVGYKILSNLRFYKYGALYVYYHHERYDGKGYPKGLKGIDIPLGARIMAVADSYDAMTSDRVYRKALSHEEAITELINNAGTQFDPGIVRIFVDILHRENKDQLKLELDRS